MNRMTHIEKQKIERELRMEGGYVLDFSNRTFEEFFKGVLSVNIYSSQFSAGSGSKASRIREFWKIASDAQLRLLFQGLLDGWDIYSKTPITDSGRILLEQLARKHGESAATTTRPHTARANVVDSIILDNLFRQLVAISSLTPQKRGYAFESFLKDLFNAYELSARASFRNSGEQIDGSFVLHNETYLLEAKWQNAPSAAADLHTFEGKLQQKATWSRGLFVSNSGFSKEGLEAFGRGKRIVCMDGYDISEMLRLRLSFTDVMEAKIRSATETGLPFVSVRELFSK